MVGLATSVLVNFFVDAKFAAHIFGVALNPREASDWAQLAGILMNICVGSAWFVITPLLQPQRSPAEVDQVNKFFDMMHTPIDFAKEEGAGSDNLQAKVMGILCLIYGGFILLLMAIPNPLIGRLAFAFCGITMFGIGLVLYRASRARKGIAISEPAGSPPPPGEILAQTEVSSPPRGFEVVSPTPDAATTAR